MKAMNVVQLVRCLGNKKACTAVHNLGALELFSQRVSIK